MFQLLETFRSCEPCGIILSSIRCQGESDLKDVTFHIESLEDPVPKPNLAACRNILQIWVHRQLPRSVKMDFQSLPKPGVNTTLPYSANGFECVSRIKSSKAAFGEIADKPIEVGCEENPHTEVGACAFPPVRNEEDALLSHRWHDDH